MKREKRISAINAMRFEGCTPGEARCVVALLKQLALMSSEGNDCTPRLAVIAKRCGVTIRTARRWRATAERLGVLRSVERLGGRGGGRRSNKYLVQWERVAAVVTPPDKTTAPPDILSAPPVILAGRGPDKTTAPTPGHFVRSVVVENRPNSAGEATAPAAAETAGPMLADVEAGQEWAGMPRADQLKFIASNLPVALGAFKRDPECESVLRQMRRLLREQRERKEHERRA